MDTRTAAPTRPRARTVRGGARFCPLLRRWHCGRRACSQLLRPYHRPSPTSVELELAYVDADAPVEDGDELAARTYFDTPKCTGVY